MINNKTLCAVVAGLIGLTGCNRKIEYVYGTVLKESGSIIDRQSLIEKSSEAMFGNESVKFGDPTYAIQFRTDDQKVYTFQVIPNPGLSGYGSSRFDALNLAINEGTKIKIPAWCFNPYNLKGTVGSIHGSYLIVLSQ